MSEPACRVCGDVPNHSRELELCCYCWVFGNGGGTAPREQHPGHRGCRAATKLLGAVQHRQRESVLAERECCAHVVEELATKQPLDAMPRVLRQEARRSPETVLRSILDCFAENVVAVIRARIA